MLIAVALAFFAAEADAQRRTTTRRPAARPAPTPAPVKPPASTVEITNAAQKTSTQIKNITKFIYLLGSVAKGIEDIDKDTRANRAARDANDKNKRELIQAMRNLRAGIGALENEFNTTPALARFRLSMTGTADLALQAERLASNGQFSDSGKPLLTLVERLSDALVNMR